MTAVGVIPHHDQVCVCGQPIKPCPITLGPALRTICRGYIHTGTLTHACKGRENSLAEPREAP